MTFDKLISSCKSALAFSGADASARSRSKSHPAGNTSATEGLTCSLAHRKLSSRGELSPDDCAGLSLAAGGRVELVIGELDRSNQDLSEPEASQSL